MKNNILNVLYDYLLLFPEERERQAPFFNYLQKYSEEKIIDWNNFAGHIVAGGFIYARKKNK